MSVVIPWPEPSAGVYETQADADLVARVVALRGTPHPRTGAPLRFGTGHVKARMRTLTYDANGRRDLALAHAGDDTALRQLAADADHYAYEHP